ncbi:MAG: family glycosyltransferase [Candidatus Acidoferrum typicum]|nr:family glycosyltransferase [Candidatus Acidoferrum typicum]
MISPFLDRRHGTERVILEQVERFAERPDTEIHIYAQQLADLAGVSRFPSANDKQSGRIFWHKVPSLPGPHLFAYVWWFFANHFCRWRDARFRKLKYDLLYSPGINALDADVIAVHIVFHEFYRRIRSDLRLNPSSIASWPRLMHRRLYYWLIMMLERRVYPRRKTRLVAVSQLVSRHLQDFFERSDACVVPNAVDTHRFTSQIRAQRREPARAALHLSSDIFVLLIIGNDWAKKGLGTLLNSLAACHDLPMTLLVVGSDDRNIFLSLIDRLGLRDRVQFHSSTDDVEHFYAAADLYAGPSLEDSFALPPLEAMACGLPVITSVNNGGSQIITEGVDGFVLSDPRDAVALSTLLRRLYQNPEFCARVGANAAQTAQGHTWDRNARDTWDVLTSTLRKKGRSADTDNV